MFVLGVMMFVLMLMVNDVDVGGASYGLVGYVVVVDVCVGDDDDGVVCVGVGDVDTDDVT